MSDIILIQQIWIDKIFGVLRNFEGVKATYDQSFRTASLKNCFNSSLKVSWQCLFPRAEKLPST